MQLRRVDEPLCVINCAIKHSQTRVARLEVQGNVRTVSSVSTIKIPYDGSVQKIRHAKIVIFCARPHPFRHARRSKKKSVTSTLMPNLPRPIASRSNLYLKRTSPLHRKEGSFVRRVWFPSHPSVSRPQSKFRCVRGQVDLPNPHSTPSKNSRGRAPVKSGDLGAAGRRPYWAIFVLKPRQ